MTGRQRPRTAPVPGLSPAKKKAALPSTRRRCAKTGLCIVNPSDAGILGRVPPGRLKSEKNQARAITCLTSRFLYEQGRIAECG